LNFAVKVWYDDQKYGPRGGYVDIADDVLNYYSQSSGMTEISKDALDVSDLPDEGVPGLVRTVQGLLVHAFWVASYGVSPAPERGEERHVRSASEILDGIRRLDDRPLSVARPAERRLICICRHFAVLMTALLRAKGIPARARCGFATYFEISRFVDHWVCEYWREPEARWVLVDAQLDHLQRTKLSLDLDLLDVPRDRFLVAGDAWALYRDGKADPSAFGIRDMRGAWWIASSLIRDLAALNKIEMLPWDRWGAMPRPGWSPTSEWLRLFDPVASLTRDPDSGFDALRECYAQDLLCVPPTVFNAVRQRAEPVPGFFQG
jgi:hypothetical protein